MAPTVLKIKIGIGVGMRMGTGAEIRVGNTIRMRVRLRIRRDTWIRVGMIAEDSCGSRCRWGTKIEISKKKT